MKNYLTLLCKSDFTDLFKFGYLYIDKSRVVEFDGNLSALSQNMNVKDQLFERANQFDYSFTVLLVYFQCEQNNGRLNIEDVQNIFALDNDAKREIEISYDPRIRIDNPIWPDVINTLQERFLFEDAKKGPLNIWKILNIEQPISEVMSIFSNEDIKEIAYEVQNDRRPKGDLSFWVYLLRYERHGFFPKNTAGFFMDLMNTYVNTLQKKEIPSEAIESTGIYQKILDFQECNMVSLINRLAETEEGRNFFDKVDLLIQSKPNSFIIAILFLIFRNRYKDGFNLESNDMLDYSKKEFPDEFYYALYLLGIFLGNSHTFECLYDTLPLPIFKSKTQEQQPQKGETEPNLEVSKGESSFPYKNPQDSDFDNEDIHQTTELGGLFSVSTENIYSQETIVPTKKVRKPGTSGNTGTKKVRSKEHFNELLSQGYIADPKYGYLTE